MCQKDADEMTNVAGLDQTAPSGYTVCPALPVPMLRINKVNIKQVKRFKANLCFHFQVPLRVEDFSP